MDYVCHPHSENAVHADDDLVTRLYQIDETGFHASASRPGDRYRQPVLGLEDVAQEALGLIHGGEKVGIEMTDARSGQRLENSGGNIARPRSQEHPFSRVNVPELVYVNIDIHVLNLRRV
jgi:hypothetical protein